MTTCRSSLVDLPPRVIQSIFDLEPSLIHTFLVGLQSKPLHQLTRDIVYRSITIQDTISPSDPKLDTILNGPQSYGSAVRSIKVISPSIHSIHPSHHPPPSPAPTDSSSELLHLDWHSNTLTRLLTKLPNLQSFTWASDRLPIPGLTTLIGLHSPNLESFSLDIPNPPQPNHLPLPARPNGRQRAHTTNTSIEDSDSDSELLTTLKPIRWDADAIEILPPSLTKLSISSLSVIGAKNLSKAFESLTWTGLTEIELSKSLFIDDDLMASIVLGSKKIKRLRIQGMCGTKLTERGIDQLFSGLDGLEEIELLDVEGRFSKVGWLKLDDLPPSLRSIKFGYHETGSYHSWTLDHLQNIVSLLGLYPQKLEKFSITRFIPPPALIPGRHAMFPELAFNNRTAPQKISKEQIITIVAEGTSLKELNLDWWLISVEGLEVIVKGLPNLLKLTALVDAPFHRIITSTAFVHSKIHTLQVSIPPEHSPLVRELMLVPMTPTSQTSKQGMPPTPGLPAQSVSPTSSPSLSSPIPIRDLKKFIKRAGHLKEIIWTGRGGLGSWKFARHGGSALNVKVEFIPITDQLPTEAFEYQQSIHQTTTSGHNSKYPYHFHHQRAGSSPRQVCGGQYSSSRSGSIGLNVTHNRSKRRTSSVTTTEGSTVNDSQGYSRRSSSGSLDTSWSSSCNNYYPPSSTHPHKLELEGIPGTPAGELNDNQVDSIDPNLLDRKDKTCLIDLVRRSMINEDNSYQHDLSD